MSDGWRRFVATNDSIGPLVLRLALGVVMFAHGAQKVLGWWGGAGVTGTFEAFQQAWGIPPYLTVLTMMAEFGGGLLLIVGALTRLAALAIGINMVVAVLVNHVQHGFFMDWYGVAEGHGFEYHILAVGMAVALLVHGGGKASIDRALERREEVTRRPTVVAAPPPREPVAPGGYPPR
ncbi:MAG: DoxX family protein [Planctomycetes bacterium]|nr:DoxX family protein [Planctomycetota bacterium]